MTSGQRLSICMISDDFIPAATGVGTHLQQVSAFLAARGHRILVITTRRPGQPTWEEWNGVQIRRVATVKVFGFFQGVPLERTIEKLLRDFKPDLVHFHYLGVMMLRAMRVADHLGLRKVYTYHMTEDHLTQPLPMKPFRRLIARLIVRLCNRVNLVITVARTTADQLPARGITTPIHYISNPVGFRDAESAEVLPSADSFKVLFVGRLNPEKNVPLLLHGFANLLKHVPGARLWIAGEGTQKGALEQLCEELDIATHVEFLGFLSHSVLARYYASCDVFVLPSFVETQGLVAMEAMRFAKPIIVARSVVSATELVDEGINGYIVDERSPEALAAKMLALAGDADVRRRMGAAGREKSDEFSPDRVIPALEAEYERVLSRPA